MSVFNFKRFSVDDAGCAMKVGTDSVLLGAWTDVSASGSIVDLGAGSGLLALMMAQRTADASITAIEIDAAACAAASANFAASPWHARLTAICGDVIDFKPASPVDLMICNPPYFTDSLLPPDSQRTQARHVTGAFGPVEAVRLAASWLSDTGSLAMITPSDCYDAVIYASEMHRLNVWRVCRVSTSEAKPPSRILWQITRDRSRRYEPSNLTLWSVVDGKRRYTDAYKSLTADFYLTLN